MEMLERKLRENIHESIYPFLQRPGHLALTPVPPGLQTLLGPHETLGPCYPDESSGSALFLRSLRRSSDRTPPRTCDRRKREGAKNDSEAAVTMAHFRVQIVEDQLV